MAEKGAHAVKVGGSVGEEKLVALAEGVDTGGGIAVLGTFPVAGRQEGALETAFGQVGPQSMLSCWRYEINLLKRYILF